MKKTFGLIGFPLTHSFSQKYFTDKFLRLGISDECSYENFEIKDVFDFTLLVKSRPDIVGLNVTIPHKEKIIPLLDEINDFAQAVGAVNTIFINRDPGSVIKTTGFNTDITGFKNTLEPLLKNLHTGAMVLGTGGASKAVIYCLQLLNIPFITVSRNPNAGTITYSELTPELLKMYPVIINTTPLGTFPDVHSAPDLPYDCLGPENLLYDLVYNPGETLFMKKGIVAGASVTNGYDMLVAQAEAAWKIWKKGSLGH